MTFDRRKLIILLILIGAIVLVCAVSAHDVSAAKTSKTKVKIYNFQPGVLWGPKAVKLSNGDAIAGYVTYDGNMQFQRGTGVTSWYIGSGIDGDIEPHHTKLVKVKFYFKSKHGKVTKTVKGSGSHIRTDLIDGYTPYKAKVWYKSY